MSYDGEHYCGGDHVADGAVRGGEAGMMVYVVIPYLLGERSVTFADLGEAMEYAEENFFDPGYEIIECEEE